jgi:hypothetical protein
MQSWTTAERLLRRHSASIDAFGVTPQVVATMDRDYEELAVGETPSREAKKFSRSSRATRVGEPSTSE